MNIVQTYGKEIVSLLVPFIAWGLSAFFKNKPRLRIAQPHTFTFVAPPILDNNGVETSAGLTVHTRSFLIYNDGREAATKLELVFNWKPLCLNIWPPRRYTEQVEPDKRYILIFESLSPDEALGCEVLSVKEELPNLLTVRSDQSEAKFINMYPQPVVNKAIRVIAAFLMAAGLATVVYCAILLLQFLVLETPLGH